MFMNQHEIEDAASRKYDCQNVRKAVNLLQALVHSVNEQSDGWAYWNPPSKSCQKLQELLKTALNHGTITDSELKKAISPIRAMVKRQKAKQSFFGNTFDFDVDAALTLTNV